jgi:hypothetical protein
LNPPLASTSTLPSGSKVNVVSELGESEGVYMDVAGMNLASVNGVENKEKLNVSTTNANTAIDLYFTVIDSLVREK